MMYNPLFVLLQPQKWYTFGLQFGTLWHYYLQQRQNLVSVERNQVSDLEHFPFHLSTECRHLSGWMVVWIFVRLSTSFCTRQPDLHPWNLVSKCSGIEKQKMHRQSFDYQCIFFVCQECFSCLKWSRGESNPRPNLLQRCFLHV